MPIVIITVTAAASLTLVGCGSDSSAKPAAAGTPTASPSPALPPLPDGCTTPSRALTYTSGIASVDVTAGPGLGHHDLVLVPDSTDESKYDPSLSRISGVWGMPGQGKIFTIDVDAPCKNLTGTVDLYPDGPDGSAYPDSYETKCQITLPKVSDAGADGTFTCSQLPPYIVKGASGPIDAKGTFSLRS